VVRPPFAVPFHAQPALGDGDADPAVLGRGEHRHVHPVVAFVEDLSTASEAGVVFDRGECG